MIDGSLVGLSLLRPRNYRKGNGDACGAYGCHQRDLGMQQQGNLGRMSVMIATYIIGVRSTCVQGMLTRCVADVVTGSFFALSPYQQKEWSTTEERHHSTRYKHDAHLSPA